MICAFCGRPVSMLYVNGGCEECRYLKPIAVTPVDAVGSRHGHKMRRAKYATCPACGHRGPVAENGMLWCKNCKRCYMAGREIRTVICPACGTAKETTSKTNCRCRTCGRRWSVAD